MRRDLEIQMRRDLVTTSNVHKFSHKFTTSNVKDPVTASELQMCRDLELHMSRDLNLQINQICRDFQLQMCRDLQFQMSRPDKMSPCDMGLGIPNVSLASRLKTKTNITEKS